MSDDQKNPPKTEKQHQRDWNKEQARKKTPAYKAEQKKIFQDAVKRLDEIFNKPEEVKKSEEPLIKMPIRNTEENAEIGADIVGYQADHFKGHPALGRGYQNEGHETHHSTTQLDSGLYHHVFKLDSHSQRTLQGSDTRHILSNHADPSLPGVASMHTKTGASGNGHLNRHGYHQVMMSQVHPDERGKGHGRTLYNSALKYHGKLASGTLVSDKAHKVWENWSSSDPRVKVKLAPFGVEKPHYAQFKKSEWTNEPISLKKTMTIGHAAGLENTKTGGAALEAPQAEEHVTKPLKAKALGTGENGRKLKITSAKMQAKKELAEKNPDEDWDKHLVLKMEVKAKLRLIKAELDYSWIFIDIDEDDLAKYDPKHEGEIHPHFHTGKPWVAKTHPTKKVVMWHANPKQAHEFDEKLRKPNSHKVYLTTLKEPHLSTYKKMVNDVRQDPHRHFIPCGEGGKDILRARHLFSLLEHNNPVRSDLSDTDLLGHNDTPRLDTTDPNHLIIHRQSHSEGKHAGKLVSIKIPIYKKETV